MAKNEREGSRKRPSVEELGGESEHSLRLSRGGERRVASSAKGGPKGPADLSLDPEDLGRHFLQEATEETALMSNEDDEEEMAQEPAQQEDVDEVLSSPDGTITEQDVLLDRREDDGIERKPRHDRHRERRT
jgi:hypothetical protein